MHCGIVSAKSTPTRRTTPVPAALKCTAHPAFCNAPGADTFRGRNRFTRCFACPAKSDRVTSLISRIFFSFVPSTKIYISLQYLDFRLLARRYACCYITKNACVSDRIIFCLRTVRFHVLLEIFPAFLNRMVIN